MFKVKIAVSLLLMGLVGSWAARADRTPQASVPSNASAQESWRSEFDAVCSKTDDAMTLSEDDLTSLIRRCDALVPQIQKLDESRKKVFLGRLRMCRGLYAYVLDAKRNEEK